MLSGRAEALSGLHRASPHMPVKRQAQARRRRQTRVGRTKVHRWATRSCSMSAAHVRTCSVPRTAVAAPGVLNRGQRSGEFPTNFLRDAHQLHALALLDVVPAAHHQAVLGSRSTNGSGLPCEGQRMSRRRARAWRSQTISEPRARRVRYQMLPTTAPPQIWRLRSTFPAHKTDDDDGQGLSSSVSTSHEDVRTAGSLNLLRASQQSSIWDSGRGIEFLRASEPIRQRQTDHRRHVGQMDV